MDNALSSSAISPCETKPSFLLVHNSYRQHGGEDIVFEAERDLLAAAGHQVFEYRRHNDEIKNGSLLRGIGLARDTCWSQGSYREIRKLIRERRPDVAYFHNFLPLISPAAYYACQEEGVPVVQTLQNYRLACPVGTFFRDGHICEECREHSLLRSVRHGCYRDSRPATTAVAFMLSYHRLRDTWSRMVDRYISPSYFLRNKLVSAGVPAQKIVVKPNFLHSDPGERSTTGDYAMFLGRWSKEKGLSTLMEALPALGPDISLLIVGDGPMVGELESVAAAFTNVRVARNVERAQVFQAIKNARFLLLPSLSYEGFPTIILESYACGVPVIASRLGAMEELVHDGRTGLLFEAGNAADLVKKLTWAWHNPAHTCRMGQEARAEYVNKYTAERSYLALMDIVTPLLPSTSLNSGTLN